MGSSAEAVPTSSAQVVSNFFHLGKSAKTHAILRMSLKSLEQRDRASYLRNWNVNVLLGSRCWKTMFCSTKRCGTPFLGKTLKTSLSTTTWSWNVNDLLHSRWRILFWEKTFGTSRSTTSANGLLGKVEDRRHCHQLFRRLRRTENSTTTAGGHETLGTSITWSAIGVS